MSTLKFRRSKSGSLGIWSEPRDFEYRHPPLFGVSLGKSKSQGGPHSDSVAGLRLIPLNPALTLQPPRFVSVTLSSSLVQKLPGRAVVHHNEPLNLKIPYVVTEPRA